MELIELATKGLLLAGVFILAVAIGTVVSALCQEDKLILQQLIYFQFEEIERKEKPE